MNIANQAPRLRDLGQRVDKRLRRAGVALVAKKFVEDGHYYSPVPALDDVRARDGAIFAIPTSVPGIDLQLDEQLELVRAFGAYYNEQSFPAVEMPDYRYFFKNNFFGFGDAIMLYSMIRHEPPARIFEIGSGFSSAVMLDTLERFSLDNVACTFVDPDPVRIRALFRAGDHDKHEVVTDPVQNMDLGRFDELQSGDILFIDSSHVTKVGSDVNHLFFHVLPRLAKGVRVHVHDVYYPFEYPKPWVYEGRAWNEAYLLRALLTDNKRLKVLLWNSCLEKLARVETVTTLPMWGTEPGGSIWLRVQTDADAAAS